MIPWIGPSLLLLYVGLLGFIRGRSHAWTLTCGLLIVLAIVVARAVVLSSRGEGTPPPADVHTEDDEEESDETGNQSLTGDTALKESLWPGSWPNRIFFLAMLGSFLAAFILYQQHPECYMHLDIHRGQLAYVVLNFGLPYLQFLCAFVAVVTLESFVVHMLAALLYLSIFVIWDIILWIRFKRSASLQENDQAKKFIEAVNSYFWSIDLPTWFCFGVLFLFAVTRSPEDRIAGFPEYPSVRLYAHAFMSGVVASQAFAALFLAQIELWRKDTSLPPPPIGKIVQRVMQWWKNKKPSTVDSGSEEHRNGGST